MGSTSITYKQQLQTVSNTEETGKGLKFIQYGKGEFVQNFRYGCNLVTCSND